MKAKVTVMLKAGVLDPQGEAVKAALATMDYQGVNSVRQGKVIELELDESDPDKARAAVEGMCETLLANTVIERYDIELS